VVAGSDQNSSWACPTLGRESSAWVGSELILITEESTRK
jgi:hypothetical protein